ncbi:nuclear transport factor 2 family protein [Candidatus Palauibacter soopunensis]|uniref:YybH family protein n=1 Tax=Candidatus Palauibacter soopunensis TaxID=3056739 RepID=UPI00238D4A0D|nr:nuclear transport factor 2 family protein [Candidatus Palauibacter soopunensis]MDE2877776.1 nuclear transport factor 2 family protein [Candidatus Palauibacter soopunensis]
MIRNRSSRRRRSGLAAATAVALAAGLMAGGCEFVRLDSNGAPAPDEGPDLAEQVASLLDRQAAAWNAGDLDGFMSAYSPSPTTTYIGSTGLIEGYDGIRERYAPDFAEGAARDSLRFEGLRVREVDERVGVATARYVLEREGTVTSTGPFTLVLLNVEGAWLIVHDQSAEDGGG